MLPGDAPVRPDGRVGHVLLLLRSFQLVGRSLHHAKRHGQPGRSLRSQRGVRGLPGQRAIGDGVQDGGHPGADLPRRAHAALMPGSWRQCRAVGGGLLAGPVPGQQGVEHPGQGHGVSRPTLGGGRIRGGAAERRVEAEAGDLEAAAWVPAQRARGQSQVRPASLMREGERVRRVSDHGGRQGRPRQPGKHQVLQVRAGGPFGHDIGALRAVRGKVGVVDGRQARIGHLGG